jgi:hypothetical protein
MARNERRIPAAGFRREDLAEHFGMSPIGVDKAWRRGDLPAPIYIGRIPYWPASVVAEFETKSITESRAAK